MDVRRGLACLLMLGTLLSVAGCGTEEDIFPRRFCLTSGVGGWSTELCVAADGSFSGAYYAWDWDHMTEEDPLCYLSFTGQFSKPEQVNEYSCSMKLEQIDVDGDLLGLEGEEYFVYLPGAPLEELPEEFLFWVRNSNGLTLDDTTLPTYGLYSVKEECGFFEVETY